MVLAKDLSHFLSEEAKSRKDSPLKAMFKYRSQPGMRSLGGGLPVPDLFPFDDVSAVSPQPPFTDGVELRDYSGTAVQKEVITRAIGKGPQEYIELATSLQYGSSLGEDRLRGFVKEHTSRVHSVAYEDWDVILSCGNSFAWDALLRTFTNRGDTILAEEFAFSSALETAHAQGCKTVGVRMDLEGIVPGALDDQLTNWVGPKPKLLYTVPTGQNPTGSSLSSERRREIYKIAQKHDFIIVEDEPYYYLQFPEYSHDKHESATASTTDAMVKSLVPSFLNCDVDGRVVRLDSFSKVIAPGTRLGWVVAQSRFIERFLRLYETSMQAPSGFSTSLVYGLLRRWGQEGYLTWLNKLKDVYSHARDVACDAIVENLPKGRYQFEPPVAGMFFWIRVDARQYKGFAEHGKDPMKVEQAIFKEALARNVMIVPGSYFLANDVTNPPQPELPVSEDDKYAVFFRGTFAGVSHDILRSALADFGKLLHEVLVQQ